MDFFDRFIEVFSTDLGQSSYKKEQCHLISQPSGGPSQITVAHFCSFWPLPSFVCNRSTVHCKETQLFCTFLYKMVIFTSLKIILKVGGNLPMLSHFLISISISFWDFVGCKIFSSKKVTSLFKVWSLQKVILLHKNEKSKFDVP